MNLDATTNDPTLMESNREIIKYLSVDADARDKKKSTGKIEIKKLASAGMFGLTIPREYKGAGKGLSDLVKVVRKLAGVDAGVSLIIGTHNLIGYFLTQYGSNNPLKDGDISEIARGEKLLSAALQEYPYPADHGMPETSSTVHKGHFQLNGTKAWVSHGEFADYLIVSAAEKKSGSPGKKSFYLVEKDRDGLYITPHDEPLGLRSANLCELRLKQCRLPLSNKIESDLLANSFLLDAGLYIIVSALALGIAETTLERSRIYASERRQFDQPIAAFEAIRDKLAEMVVSLESASALLEKTLIRWESGNTGIKNAAMSKLVAARAAMFSANEALQIHGGYGYLRENEIERFLRDAKMTGIYAAPDEAIRELIARELLKSDHNNH